jgi:hypothetical protein
MIHALRLPCLAFASSALIFLASASAARAQVDTDAPLQRPSAAAPEKGAAARVHMPTDSTAQAGSRTKARASAMRTVRQPATHAAAGETTVRTTARETTVRTSGGTTVTRGGHWVWRGGRRVWQSYGFTEGGYAYGPVPTGALYGGTYGVAGHSCWWYRHYDPADLPRWCPRYYGSSYYAYRHGYSAPSYGYSYGYSAPAYSYGYRYGVTRTASTRTTSTRFANVSSTRFTNRPHGMAVRQGGAHVAVTRPAETSARVLTHAQAGAQLRAPSRAPSAAGAKVRKQTSP